MGRPSAACLVVSLILIGCQTAKSMVPKANCDEINARLKKSSWFGDVYRDLAHLQKWAIHIRNETTSTGRAATDTEQTLLLFIKLASHEKLDQLCTWDTEYHLNDFALTLGPKSLSKPRSRFEKVFHEVVKNYYNQCRAKMMQSFDDQFSQQQVNYFIALFNLQENLPLQSRAADFFDKWNYEYGSDYYDDDFRISQLFFRIRARSIRNQDSKSLWFDYGGFIDRDKLKSVIMETFIKPCSEFAPLADDFYNRNHFLLEFGQMNHLNNPMRIFMKILGGFQSYRLCIHFVVDHKVSILDRIVDYIFEHYKLHDIKITPQDPSGPVRGDADEQRPDYSAASR